MTNKMIFYKKFLMLILGVTISSFGMTLLIKSNLGQSTVSGISYNIGVILKIKTGTILAFINYICFIGQIFILKHEFKFHQILQLFITVIFSELVNFYLYKMPFISTLDLNLYIIKLFVLLTGIICMAYGVSLMLIADLAPLPFEAFVNIVSIKFNIQFGKLRRFIDISFIFISLAIILLYKVPNVSVREGTIIYALLFGTFMDIFMNSNKAIFLKKKTL